ncbi:DUF4878 domain-containing protein [Bacteroides sp. 214]|uniref:DUF4878 domain-containing protein n=1 Tax=Bacteroides sp. 214 TaxID=2302935 RepID=UPI0013D01560|nr:DUF4878 domain-containing protein [Bacteroides sp. 214]NDW11524.1 DUF4878 domain-containing protein [Bacteroides sp. 214]
MKKILTSLSLFLLLLFAFTSCSSGGSKHIASTIAPGETVLKHYDYLKQGDYEKFGEIFLLGENLPSDKAKEAMSAALNSLKQAIEKKGGVKNVKLLSEMKTSDDKTARVYILQEFEDGTSEDYNYKLTNVNGHWRIVVE